jgi:hypothetical protein
MLQQLQAQWCLNFTADTTHYCRRPMPFSPSSRPSGSSNLHGVQQPPLSSYYAASFSRFDNLHQSCIHSGASFINQQDSLSPRLQERPLFIVGFIMFATILPILEAGNVITK